MREQCTAEAAAAATPPARPTDPIIQIRTTATRPSEPDTDARKPEQTKTSNPNTKAFGRHSYPQPAIIIKAPCYSARRAGQGRPPLHRRRPEAGWRWAPPGSRTACYVGASRRRRRTRSSGGRDRGRWLEARAARGVRGGRQNRIDVAAAATAAALTPYSAPYSATTTLD